MTQITITINANGPIEIAQVAAALAALGGAAVTPAKAEAPKAAAAKPVTKAPSPTVASDDTTQEAGPDVTTDASPSEDAAEEAGAVTIDDVKEAAKAYNVKNGRDALAALIGEHGGSKGVTTIPEGNYQAFIDAANA